jgi:hypothetical protein
MTAGTTRRILLVLLLGSVSPGLFAAEWFVAPPPVGEDGNPGTREQPFATIQHGIDAATHADTVIVAEGTYGEHINFKAKNIVLRSNCPTDWAVVKRTIIDGGQSGTVVMFRGTENETCVLSGFTIRNGVGTWIAIDGMSGGGGILGVDPVANPQRSVFTLARIERNIIAGNRADMGGGVRYCKGLIRGNIIMGNQGGDATNGRCGGGISLCRGIIENNLLVGNHAPRGGAVSHCNAIFRNNTVVGNTALYHGGGLWYVGNSPYLPGTGSIANCIIHGNAAPLGPQIHESTTPRYCLVEDWTGGGTGNCSGDPQFVDPDGLDDDPLTFADNDYRLLPASICIDAGTNEPWMEGATDLDGRARILPGASSVTVDMGAYEYPFALSIVRDALNGVRLSWTMRPEKTYTVLSNPDMTTPSWGEAATILGGSLGGPAAWADPDSSPALKFYRIAIE